MLASICLIDVLTARDESGTDYLEALMCAAEEWLQEADALVVYPDAGWGPFMTHLVEAARWFDVPIEYRSLDQITKSAVP